MHPDPRVDPPDVVEKQHYAGTADRRVRVSGKPLSGGYLNVEVHFRRFAIGSAG